MMQKIKSRIGISVGLACGGLGSSSILHASPPDTLGRVHQAQSILLPVAKEFNRKILESVHERGVLLSIDTCKVPPTGSTVGRASVRSRNASERPEPWVQSILLEFPKYPSDRSQKPRPAMPYGLVKLPGDRWGYAEPIHLGTSCLNCHGESVHPDVAAKLDLLYPGDPGRGYKLNELIGAWWVEFEDIPVRSQSSGSRDRVRGSGRTASK